MSVNAARAEHFIVGARWRGAEPEIPIEPVFEVLRGQVARLRRSAEAGGDVRDFPDHAVARELARDAELARRTLHRAGLKNALIFAHRADQRPRLVDRVRQRLFAIDVLARLCRRDGDERMPMVRRRDHHRVDVLAAEQLAEIVLRVAAFEISAGLLRVETLDLLLAILAPRPVHVAHGHGLRFGF